MGNKDILAELKTKIGQKITPTPATAAVAAPREASHAPKAPRTPTERRRGAAKPPVAQKSPPSGRGVQFYLEDADRKIINNLAVWFASQDKRVSDSQVIKSAIRMAEAHQGSKLLEICEEVRSGDRRKMKRVGK